MDLRQLRVFKSVYEAGSIVGAAERERCAPSVLAHHLTNLEALVGTALFERHSRGVVPTQAGQTLYAHATSILRSVALAQDDMRDLGVDLTGTVVIGMAFSVIISISEPLMRAVIADHPRLKLDVAESLSGSTMERLLASEIDLALAYYPSRDARLLLTPLLEEEMVCMGRPEVIGPGAAPIRLQDFLKMPYILPRKGPRGRAVAGSIEQQKLLEEHALFYTESVQAASLFIRAGLGCMLGTKAYIEQRVAGSGVEFREVIDPVIKRTLFLCERKQALPSRAVSTVRKLLIELVQKEVESGRWPARLVSATERPSW